MKMMALLLLVLMNSSAWGRAGTGAGTSGYKDVNSTKGLCTRDNKNEMYYKQGYCTSIYERLVKPGCVADDLETLRAEYLDDEDPARKAVLAKHKDKDKPATITLPFGSCNSLDGKRLGDIAKNKEQFAFVVMQYFAILAAEESDWQVDANKENDTKGLLGLKQDDVKKAEYKCGCSVPNSTKEDEFPRVEQDGHYNLVCGMTMAIKNTKRDGNSDGVDKDKNGKEKPLGFASVFKVLQGNDKASKDRQKRINDRMKMFCETQAHAKSNVNSWNPVITRDSNIKGETVD